MGAQRTVKGVYFKTKKELLEDKEICTQNRTLFKEFFEFQEYKLKRKNGLSSLDEGTYKTLYTYAQRLRNVNNWFKNKPFKDLTKADIKRVYDALEDGRIKNKIGKPFKDKESYYNKIFKSKVFKMAGHKDDIARDVIEFSTKKEEEVRYVDEEAVRKLVDNTTKSLHKLLIWLAFDVGENITSLLQLKKSDFYPQKNKYNKEPEYRVNLRRETLKRSRRTRSEITNYNETVKLLDEHLKPLKDDELLFPFDYRNAKKILDRLVTRTKIKTHPAGLKPTWKDLRSGMACDLLKKSWTTDEVNARLGHKPSSTEIDKYVNFLAIDRESPKRKVQQYEIEKLSFELEEMKRNEKLNARRREQEAEELKKELEAQALRFKELEKAMKHLKKK